jgi:hypothetical protein
LPEHRLFGNRETRGAACRVSHNENREVMPIAGINSAFELMKRGESIRGVVTF